MKGGKNRTTDLVPKLLFLAFSLIFLIAMVISAANYSWVVKAQKEVMLENADCQVRLLQNGSLDISFSIDLVNPTRYQLMMQTVGWSVKVLNYTDGSGNTIPLGTRYIGPTQFMSVSAREVYTFSYTELISDSARLSKLHGFINYSASVGTNYNLESIPYVHDFEVIAWIDDFKHDYMREDYLNDLVSIDLTYSSNAEDV